MGFNLEDYEDINTRIQRFQKLHPVGRIEVDVISHDIVAGCILVRALVFKEHEDTLPAGVDIAFGQRDLYPQNLRKFYVEDTSTSAIGRALALVLETKNKPTRQDMERVEQGNKFQKRVESFAKEKVEVENPKDPWSIVEKPMPLTVTEALTELNNGILPEEIPMCRHGAMQNKQGVGKTNRPYFGYTCTASKNDQCDPIWYNLDKSGRWIPQKPVSEQGVIN